MTQTKHWYALKVRSTFEETVIRELRDRNFEVFLPKTLRDIGAPGEVQESNHSRNVLCRFSSDERNAVQMVPGVLCILGIPDPVPLDDQEVTKLRNALLSDTSQTVS